MSPQRESMKLQRRNTGCRCRNICSTTHGISRPLFSIRVTRQTDRNLWHSLPQHSPAHASIVIEEPSAPCQYKRADNIVDIYCLPQLSLHFSAGQHLGHETKVENEMSRPLKSHGPGRLRGCGGRWGAHGGAMTTWLIKKCLGGLIVLFVMPAWTQVFDLSADYSLAK